MKGARKPGEVIQKVKMKDKNGKDFTLVMRCPKEDDIDRLLSFINGAVGEARHIALNRKQERDSEAAWLNSLLSSIEKGQNIDVLAELDGEVIANSEVRRLIGRNSHVGDLGIIVREKYTGLGIGRMLIKLLEEEAKNLDIEVMIIKCYLGNARAKHVYESLDYVQCGLIPKAVKQEGCYDDEIIFCKDIGTKGSSKKNGVGCKI